MAQKAPIAKIGSIAKTERAARTGLTHYWFNLAKTHSGKSSARIMATLKGFSNLDDLSDGEKKLATRYANGSSAMEYHDLKTFVQECQEMGLLPPLKPNISGIRNHGLKENILKSPEPGQAIRDIIDFNNQFETRRAGLVKALNEYSDFIEAADNRYIPVLDTLSEIEGDYSEVNNIPDVQSSHMRLLAESVKKHYLLTDL